MTSHQTIGGEPVTRFKRLSAPTRSQPNNPYTMFGCVLGKPSAGKTRFFMTCPDAFIINADCSEVPLVSGEQAGIWPTKNDEGFLIGSTGQPINFNWEMLEEMVTTLCNLKPSDEERPRFVVLDTIAGLMSLGQDYLVRKAGKSNWKDLNGLAAWDSLYNMIIQVALDLRDAGYGVFFVMHILDKILHLPGSENAQKEVVSLTITDNFWSRFFWRLDFSGVIVREWTVKNVQIRQEGRDQLVTRQERVRQHTLTVDREPFASIVKSRVDMPDVALSPGAGWSDFVTAYTNPPQEN